LEDDRGSETDNFDVEERSGEDNCKLEEGKRRFSSVGGVLVILPSSPPPTSSW